MADAPESDSAYDLAPKAPETPRPEPAEAPAQPPRSSRSSRVARPARTADPAASAELPLAAAPEAYAPATIPVAAPGAQAWTCIICGFQADAKPRRGVCPECGAPADPRATGLLQYSMPSWLRRLASGALVLFAGVLLQVVAVVAAYGWDAFRAGVTLQLTASVLQLLGIWIVTSREPYPLSLVSPLAWPTRLAGLVALLLFVALAVQLQQHPDIFPTLLTTLVLLATGAVAFLTAFSLRHLALRVPSDALATHTLNLAWIAAGVCLVVAGFIFTGFARAVNDTPGKLFMFTIPMIGAFFAIIVWSEWILLRLFLNLRDCAVAAATPPRKRAAPRPQA
jgi:hypothetical protein